MTAYEIALLVTAGLCPLAIAAIIVAVALKVSARMDRDEHESTDDCRN
ncbi:MAG: hypothetical protein ACLFVU_02140 [Phycisphaerae bacterium]